MTPLEDLAEGYAALTAAEAERNYEISAQQELMDEGLAAIRTTPSPIGNYGDRSVWRFIDPTDPWSDLVNRDGFTPGGVRIFWKEQAA